VFYKLQTREINKTTK